jgi:glycosyltransferase involved in cell wall biosynthesis
MMLADRQGESSRRVPDGKACMKLLLVGNYLPDRQDSMQLYASMLASGMRQRGHDVRLLHPPAVLGPYVAAQSPLSKWLGYADKFLLFRRELRRAAVGADLVHLCDHSNAMYVPALARIPHLVTCHDILAIRSARGHFPENPIGPAGRIFQALIARGLQRAATILCVSAKTRDDLHQYLHVPEDRLHVVPNGLHWPYQPLDRAARCPLLQQLGLAPHEPYFLHIGANHWYKNRAAAIAIFAELRKLASYASARLVMAGRPMTPELEAAAEQCGVRGAILAVPGPTNQQLQALYSGALAMLFPSREEGFGWPIVEAQACGCPVAIANRRPMNDVAGGAAIFIDPDDPWSAGRGIADALEDAARLRAAGQQNATRYNADRMLDQCETLYREITAEAGLAVGV